ncbi:hypothetical protein Q9L58_005524 [Maublancomyces gigas]|uniref:Uncharacterized protein n=1 Tax=Discina gigas TaxID=1032678 RepID=A0ABR3GHX6_9PEZI
MSHLDRSLNICIGQDEASAPAPIQSPRSSPRLEDTTLQQTRSSASAGQNVTAAAPVLHSLTEEERMGDSPTRHTSSIRTPPSLELFDVVSEAAETATPPATPEREGGNILPLLHTMSWLIFFSILGTLARLGLSGLTTYPGSPIGGVIWAQFAGCVLIGFLIEDLRIFTLRPPRNSFSSSPGFGSGVSKEFAPRSKATLPLYLGLTTGFCGSLTSFSSFLLVTFELLSNTAPAYDGRPTKGYNLLAALAYLIGTLSLSFSGLQFGAQLALFAQPLLPSIPYRTATTLDWIAVPLSVGSWMGIVVMAVLVPRWREEALMACVFAPLGVGVRFWVSRWLNARVRTFPVGTFAVNVVGTAVLAGLVVGRYRLGGAGTGCGVLRGWGDGFCGCLTTVSTFVVEVRGLRPKHGYVYAGASVLVGFCLMVLVLGSYTWSHDVNILEC